MSWVGKFFTLIITAACLVMGAGTVVLYSLHVDYDELVDHPKEDVDKFGVRHPEGLRTKLKALHAENAAYGDELVDLERDIRLLEEAHQTRLAQLERENIRQQKKVADLVRTRSDMDAQLRKGHEEVRMTLAELKTKREELANTRKEKDESEKARNEAFAKSVEGTVDLNQLQVQLDRLKTRLEPLKKQLEDLKQLSTESGQ